MSKVFLLDSTLRDGGYCNNWNFGTKIINQITTNLNNAGVDYIESGILSQQYTSKSGCTLYNSLFDFQEIQLFSTSTPVLLMDYHKNNLLNLLCHNKVSMTPVIRLAFYKDDVNEALDYVHNLVEFGYSVFVHPMAIHCYSLHDFRQLTEQVNMIKSSALYLVDSFGALMPDELLKYVLIVEEGLDINVKIGIHLHNNMQQAFYCATEILHHVNEHDLIIDCSLRGLGRGGGNIPTEVISSHLCNLGLINLNYNSLLLALNSITNFPFNSYTVPYYLTAIHRCHPKYADYLIEHHCEDYDCFNKILDEIEKTGIMRFDYKLIDDILSHM